MKKTLLLMLASCCLANLLFAQQQTYEDKPYIQDYSIKYYMPDSTLKLSAVQEDRNGVIAVLSSKGILKPQGGAFQYPGLLQSDRSYKPVAEKHIAALALQDNQLVYLDDKEVFSNAFAGKWIAKHGLPQASLLCTGTNFMSAVSDGKHIRIFRLAEAVAEAKIENDVLTAIKFDPQNNRFLLLGKHSISSLSAGDKSIKTVFEGKNLTCFDVVNDKIFVGTKNGYFILDSDNFKILQPVVDKLPVPNLTAISVIRGKLWFGSAQGAFMRRDDGKFNYYFGERWLPGNEVAQISAGDGNRVLVLTNKGLGDLHFDPMTLEEKALVYEKQVRLRHIRYGFNCDVSTLKHGDLSTFEMGQRDSDNLWTSMYLVSQLFRYKVTGSQEALDNCLESFEAMERLFDITGMKGYFARGFERRGYHKFSNKAWDGGLTNGWTHAKGEDWDWRGTTSSDQTVGQMFTLTMMAELMDGDVKKRAIYLMDQLMTISLITSGT